MTKEEVTYLMECAAVALSYLDDNGPDIFCDEKAETFFKYVAGGRRDIPAKSAMILLQNLALKAAEKAYPMEEE